MTGGTKVINRSLTIISLMVMIAAGSLIITIPEASAEGTQIVFNIEPVVNDLIVPDCEATVYCADDLELYTNFQSDDEGVIAIDSDSFLWDWMESPGIFIELTEPTNTIVFASWRGEIGVGTIDLNMKICGVLASDTTTTKNFVYSMQMKNKDEDSIGMIHTQDKGGNSINVKPLTASGKIKFSCLYSSHFTSDINPFELSYEYKFALEFNFEIIHKNTIPGPINQVVYTTSYLANDAVIPNVDNTYDDGDGYCYGSDSHYDPMFSYQLNAYSYQMGYYIVTLKCDWTIYRRQTGNPFTTYNTGTNSNDYTISISFL